jgi:hypothetical protein
MKSILILAIALGFSGQALATGTGDYGSVNNRIELEGKEAESLANVLGAIGAYEDGAMGTFGTGAENISCGVTKNEENSEACTLSVQDDTGSQTNRVLSGKLAQELTTILIDAGVVGCGMESCQGSAASISCLHGTSDEGQANSSRCSIAQ